MTAARTLFVERGYADTTVAEAAGVAVNTVYTSVFAEQASLAILDPATG